MDEEVTETINSVIKLCYSLNKALKRKREISKKAKITVPIQNCGPIYGSEMWVLNSRLISSLQAKNWKYRNNSTNPRRTIN